MTLPTREDINVHDSLDERMACANFLGKDLEEAEALFRENSLFYQEDLLYMGPRAFRFYVQALLDYIRSDAAAGDADIVSCTAGILEFRLEDEAEELRPVARPLASICEYIVAHYDRFDVTAEIYGDLRPRFRTLQQALSGLAPEP
ncbi:MAG: hypothetical protein WD069_17265 [Planctomycetales bacterium]